MEFTLEPDAMEKNILLVGARKGYHETEQPEWLHIPDARMAPHCAALLTTLSAHPHVVAFALCNKNYETDTIMLQIDNRSTNGKTVNGGAWLMNDEIRAQMNNEQMPLYNEFEVAAAKDDKSRYLTKNMMHVDGLCDSSAILLPTYMAKYSAPLVRELDTTFPGDIKITHNRLELPLSYIGQVALNPPDPSRIEGHMIPLCTHQNALYNLYVNFCKWAMINRATFEPKILMNQYMGLRDSHFSFTPYMWNVVYVVEGSLILQPYGECALKLDAGEGAWFPGRLAVVSYSSARTISFLF